MDKTTLFSALVSISLLFTSIAHAEGGNPEERVKLQNNKALLQAAEQGDLREVRALLEEGADPRYQNENGWNALHMVARYSGKAEILNLLKASGADLDAATGTGWTVLHLGARYGAKYSSAFDRFLLESGYPLDARIVYDGVNSSWTPLMLTVYGNNPRFARLLLEQGADPAIKHKGKTAADYAREEKNSALVALFEQIERDKQIASETAEREAQIARRLERDSKLPIAVRKDKYMIALTEHLKEENYQESLHYFELLDDMEVELPSSFYYFWGEALFKTGQPQASLDKLYAYINATGADGEYYRQALSLSNKAEDSL